MLTKRLFLFLIPGLLSCGQRNGITNQSDNLSEIQKNPDPEKVKYFDNVMAAGPSLFKNNCATCHCSPSGNCEPGNVPSLLGIFNELPADSLSYYISFVKNSADIRTSEYTPHEFGKNLSDSLIKTVIEYIWLTSKARARHS